MYIIDSFINFVSSFLLLYGIVDLTIKNFHKSKWKAIIFSALFITIGFFSTSNFYTHISYGISCTIVKFNKDQKKVYFLNDENNCKIEFSSGYKLLKKIRLNLYNAKTAKGIFLPENTRIDYSCEDKIYYLQLIGEIEQDNCVIKICEK